MPDQSFCALADIPDPGSKGPFNAVLDGHDVAVFVVRRGQRVWGWINSCPHVRAPLEAEPDRFLDLTGHFILCAMHGAQFHMDSGRCVLGPCKGRGLTAYEVHIRNGYVVSGYPTTAL